MRLRHPRLRPGVSLVEILVSVTLLVTMTVGLLSLASTETKGVSLSEDRVRAVILMDELRQSFGGRSLSFYQNFPAPPAVGALYTGPEFPGLTRSLVEEDPVFSERDPGARDFLGEPLPPRSAAEEDLVKWAKARGVVRGIFQKVTPAAVPNLEALHVTYRVQYQTLSGVTSFVEASEVLYP